MLVPGAVYASTLLPDAAAALLAVSGFACFVRGGRLWLALAAACVVGAALLRPWYVVLPAGLALAFALPRVRFRELGVWPRPLALVLLAGIAVTGIGGVSDELAAAFEEPGTIVRAALAAIGTAALGAAVLPWVAAVGQVSRARSDPAIALLATCTPLLALASGVAVAARDGGPRVDERPLLAVGPLVFAVAPDVLRRRDTRALLVSGAAVAAAILAVGVPLTHPALANAPGAALLAAAWDDALGRAGLLVGAAVAIGGAALLAFAGARTLLLAWAVLLVVVAGHAVAWHRLDAAAAASERAVGVPPGWIDASSGGEDVTLVSTRPPPSTESVAQLVATNSSLRAAVDVEPADADFATGAIPAQVGTPVVLAHGLDLLGRPLARALPGTLLRVDAPARLAVAVEGVAADGWTGERAAYRRFGGAAPRAVTAVLEPARVDRRGRPGHRRRRLRKARRPARDTRAVRDPLPGRSGRLPSPCLRPRSRSRSWCRRPSRPQTSERPIRVSSECRRRSERNREREGAGEVAREGGVRRARRRGSPPTPAPTTRRAPAGTARATRPARATPGRRETHRGERHRRPRLSRPAQELGRVSSRNVEPVVVVVGEGEGADEDAGAGEEEVELAAVRYARQPAPARDRDDGDRDRRGRGEHDERPARSLAEDRSAVREDPSRGASSWIARTSSHVSARSSARSAPIPPSPASTHRRSWRSSGHHASTG